MTTLMEKLPSIKVVLLQDFSNELEKNYKKAMMQENKKYWILKNKNV